MQTANEDFLANAPGAPLSQAQKRDYLTAITYEQYLQDHVGVDDEAFYGEYWRGSGGLLGTGGQAVSAADWWILGRPGFPDGVGLGDTENIELRGIGRADAPGQLSILKADCHYDQLDLPDNVVRIRLNATVHNVESTSGRGYSPVDYVMNNVDGIHTYQGGGGDAAHAAAASVRAGAAVRVSLVPGRTRARGAVTYRELMDAAPPEVGGALAVYSGRAGACQVAFCFLGDPDEGERWVTPLRELRPSLDAVGPNPYLAFQRMTDTHQPFGMRCERRLWPLEALADDVLDALLEAAARPSGSALSRIVFRPRGGVLEGASWDCECLALWPPVPSLDSAILAWADHVEAALAGAAERSGLTVKFCRRAHAFEQRVGDSAGPEVDTGAGALGDLVMDDDVGDLQPPAGAEYPVDLVEVRERGTCRPEGQAVDRR